VSDGEVRPTSSDAFHILSVDPGLVCGVAIATISLTPFVMTLNSTELPWLDAVKYMNRWMMDDQTRRHLEVTAETYTMGTRLLTPQPEALKTNGAVEFLCTLWDITFVYQPVTEPKKVVPDSLLKKLGWFKKTKDGHANDAARHVGYRLLVTRPALWLSLTDVVQ
jgi:hypothetical protein